MPGPQEGPLLIRQDVASRLPSESQTCCGHAGGGGFLCPGHNRPSQPPKTTASVKSQKGLRLVIVFIRMQGTEIADFAQLPLREAFLPVLTGPPSPLPSC